MSNEEYHAKTKYESSSTVRKVLTSPKKYLYDKTAESVPTKAIKRADYYTKKFQHEKGDRKFIVVNVFEGE